MSPTAPSRAKKAPTIVTDDMRAKIAREYRNARKAEKAGIRAKYNVSTGAINDWIIKGYADRPVNGEPAGDRPLDELLWAVVIKARETGEISLTEARKLLELVK